MNHSKFLTGLLISILACVAIYMLMANFFPQLDYTDFNYYSITMFTVIAFIVYVMTNKALKSSNRNSFLNIVVLNLGMKMLASFALVGIYIKMTSPEDKLYLIPLTINYLIFTIFETYFLSKAARVK